MITQGFKVYEVVAGGGTDSIDLTIPYDTYYIKTSGAVTLTSSYTIQAGAGTPIEGMKTQIKYRGNLDFDGNNFTVFGVSVPNEWQDKQWTADIYYNGSSWEVNLHIDFEETGGIDGDKLIDGTVTDGKIIGVDGSKITSGTITANKFDSSVSVVKYAQITISSVDILNSNSAPVDLISGVPGKIIYPIAATAFIVGGSINYTTNTDIQLISSGGSTEPIFELAGFLATPVGDNPVFALPLITPTPGAGVKQLLTNNGIQFKTKTGNPAAGDRTVRITLFYVEY
jgi:hypothetical protein